MKKRLILVGIILIVIIGILLKIHFFPSNLVLAGVVETSIYPHYSEVSGKIIELPIDLGQEVKIGNVLAVLDDKNEQYALEQMEETLVKKQAVLSELTSGIEPEELQQRQNSVSLAEIAYNNAQLTYDRAQKDYENAQVLFEAGAIAQTDLDKIKYQAESAEAAASSTALQLDNARQQLALIQKGTPQEKIDAAQADVELTQVQIRQAKDNLEKYKIVALHDGTVISKNYLLGNIVSAGFNLFDIASATEKHLVTYVPKEKLSKISYGQEVVIRSGEKEFKGTITFIDVKAQYTPRELQSSANRNKETIKIKAKLGPETPLKIGERAEAIIQI